MDKVFQKLKERDIPFVSIVTGEDSVVVFGIGYTPFLYNEDEFEIGAFYPASHTAYKLAKELSDEDKIIANPHLNYKELAQIGGLGVRGANDLIFTPEYGSLVALGAVLVKNSKVEIKREVEPLRCEECGVCKTLCPSLALDAGFNYQKCIRRQMDDGIEDWAQSLLSKSVLGCNTCSVGCVKNKVERTRPPAVFQEILQVDEFFARALSGRKGLEPLADLIGKNMIRPAKMLTLATYALRNMDEKYLKWLDSLETYPDERVVRAVRYVKSCKTDK